MISKTKISKRVKRKTDPYIVDTILAVKKNNEWNAISQKLSGGRRRYATISLDKINENCEEGDTVIVLGKVLGSGKIDKKLRICALYFSKSAKEKIKEKKGEAVTILEEINKNPKSRGVKILR